MAVRAAAFDKISAGLRRDILIALIANPLAEALREAARLGFTPQEQTEALRIAQEKAVFSHWERRT
jgi:hypothetical protein